MTLLDYIKNELKEWWIVLNAKRPGDIAHEMIEEFDMRLKDD